MSQQTFTVTVTTETTSTTQTAPAITTITNLQYPSQAIWQNSAAQATITFTVTYSGLPSGGWLFFALIQNSTGQWAPMKAAVNSTPDQCMSMTNTTYAGLSTCVIKPMSSSGTESATFVVTFDSPKQYSFVAGAFIMNSSVKVIESSGAKKEFTIAVNATSSSFDFILGLSVIAIPIILVIGLIVFLIQRKKRRPAPIPTSGWGAMTMPSAPATGDTKFCTACGARLNATANFCVKCGARQQ
jgi:hypothetical protein